MMVLCSRCRRSNIRTDPSAPTDANMSLPPPARLKAMSYTYTHTHTLLNVPLNCVHDHTLQTNTDLLVVSNQLSLYMSRHQVNSSQHLTCLQPPDGAGGVNTGGACG